MQIVRRRRSVRESNEKQKKKLKKTIDTVGVVRDTAFYQTYAGIELGRGAASVTGVYRDSAEVELRCDLRLQGIESAPLVCSRPEIWLIERIRMPSPFKALGAVVCLVFAVLLQT
jgi:hypothetical protein